MAVGREVSEEGKHTCSFGTTITLFVSCVPVCYSSHAVYRIGMGLFSIRSIRSDIGLFSGYRVFDVRIVSESSIVPIRRTTFVDLNN